jgi:hypothetical protein
MSSRVVSTVVVVVLLTVTQHRHSAYARMHPHRRCHRQRFPASGGRADVPYPASLTTGTLGRSSLQLEQVRSASPADHISLGVCRGATCVTGKASANDTKDEPSAMVKTALLTSSSLTSPLPAESRFPGHIRTASSAGARCSSVAQRARHSQDEHPGCNGFMLEMASRTGVPRSAGAGSWRSLDRRAPSTNSRPSDGLGFHAVLT